MFDEAVGVGLLGGLDHLLARGCGDAVADVVENRVVEEHRLLRDQADLAAEVAQPHVGQRHAVELHHAGRGIGKTRNQIGQRALAAAVGADDGDRLAEGDPQIDFFRAPACPADRRS